MKRVTFIIFGLIFFVVVNFTSNLKADETHWQEVDISGEYLMLKKATPFASEITFLRIADIYEIRFHYEGGQSGVYFFTDYKVHILDAPYGLYADNDAKLLDTLKNIFKLTKLSKSDFENTKTENQPMQRY